jgi:hypothetical protein
LKTNVAQSFKNAAVIVCALSGCCFIKSRVSIARQLDIARLFVNFMTTSMSTNVDLTVHSIIEEQSQLLDLVLKAIDSNAPISHFALIRRAGLEVTDERLLTNAANARNSAFLHKEIDIDALTHRIFPEKLRIGVLADVLRAFDDECDDDLRKNLNFTNLHEYKDQHVWHAATPISVPFTFEGFEWTATIRETVMKIDNKETRRAGEPKRKVWTYIIHVQLPNDSYIHSPEVRADEAQMITANTDAGREVQALSNKVFDFIERVTSPPRSVARFGPFTTLTKSGHR